jgi:hypothetical protein
VYLHIHVEHHRGHRLPFAKPLSSSYRNLHLVNGTHIIYPPEPLSSNRRIQTSCSTSGSILKCPECSTITDTIYLPLWFNLLRNPTSNYHGLAFDCRLRLEKFNTTFIPYCPENSQTYPLCDSRPSRSTISILLLGILAISLFQSSFIPSAGCRMAESRGAVSAHPFHSTSRGSATIAHLARL